MISKWLNLNPITPMSHPVTKNHTLSKKTFNILLDSFELGDKYASFAIAYCYHSGCDDFDINLDKAIYWYKINFEDSGHIA
jgi:TPR repeat protein